MISYKDFIRVNKLNKLGISNYHNNVLYNYLIDIKENGGCSKPKGKDTSNFFSYKYIYKGEVIVFFNYNSSSINPVLYVPSMDFISNIDKFYKEVYGGNHNTDVIMRDNRDFFDKYIYEYLGLENFKGI